MSLSERRAVLPEAPSSVVAEALEPVLSLEVPLAHLYRGAADDVDEDGARSGERQGDWPLTEEPV